MIEQRRVVKCLGLIDGGEIPANMTKKELLEFISNELKEFREDEVLHYFLRFIVSGESTYHEVPSDQDIADHNDE